MLSYVLLKISNWRFTTKRVDYGLVVTIHTS